MPDSLKSPDFAPMRSKILAVFAAVSGGYLGLVAFTFEVLFLADKRLPYIDWLILGVGSAHYFLIPFSMGLLLGITRGEAIWEKRESEKLAIATIGFCYLPLLALSILLVTGLIFVVSELFRTSLIVFAFLFLCGPLLLPWFRLIIYGARFGADWRDGTLRDEFFGRWSRGEKERD